jgi:hypothetical protein
MRHCPGFERLLLDGARSISRSRVRIASADTCESSASLSPIVNKLAVTINADGTRELYLPTRKLRRADPMLGDVSFILTREEQIK